MHNTHIAEVYQHEVHHLTYQFLHRKHCFCSNENKLLQISILWWSSIQQHKNINPAERPKLYNKIIVNLAISTIK